MAKLEWRSPWYIDANNIYGYARMQKLPDRDFKYSGPSLHDRLKTPHDKDQGYYIVCNIDYSVTCRDETE